MAELLTEQELDTLQTDTTKPDAPQTDTTKPDAPQTDSPMPDAPQTDAPKLDASQTDAPKPDAPQTGAPLPDTPPAHVDDGAFYQLNDDILFHVFTFLTLKEKITMERGML